MGRANSEIVTRSIIYDPLPSQLLFHECPARFKGFSGPVGSGKSQALCQEAIRLTYQNPGRTGLLGAPTYPMLRDATQATLFEILNDNKIPFEQNKAENTLVMTETRSKIIFRSMDEFERLRGTNLAWFGLDELTYTMEEAWMRLEGRLRDPRAKVLCGFAAWTPKGYDWVYRRFIAATRTTGYQAIIAKPRENRHLLAVVPDYYERLKSSYDSKFYAQEVLGDYLSLDGNRVYTSFDRAKHLADLTVDPKLPLLWTLDFNVDPMSSLIAQVGGAGGLATGGRASTFNGTSEQPVFHILGELFLRHGSTPAACAAFLERFPNHPGGVIICGDASGAAQQTSGSSDYDMITDYFKTHSNYDLQIHVPRANPSVRDRINFTNSRFESAGGDIRLYIDRKCKELIDDLEQVSYKADSGQIDKDRDRLRTHLSDALGYLVWQEGQARQSIGFKQNRLL